MAKWTKDAALKELNDLIEQTREVARGGARSATHIRWDLKVRRFLDDVFGRNSGYLRSFASLTWQATGSFVIQAWDVQGALDQRNHQAFLQQLEMAKGILHAASDELQASSLADVYEGKDTAPESSAIIKVLNLAEQKLRKVIRNGPTKEIEVQEALEGLFIGADIPYSREADAIEYSSKTYKPDFTMPNLDLAIEVKLCSRVGREKELIGEINDDILAYQTKYGNIPRESHGESHESHGHPRITRESHGHPSNRKICPDAGRQLPHPR